MSSPVDLVEHGGLSETALKLSQVIEREAKRRSGLRNSSVFRVEQNFPMFRRVSSRLRSSISRSRRSVATVSPAVDSQQRHSRHVGSSSSPDGGAGQLDPIPDSARASLKAATQHRDKDGDGSFNTSEDTGDALEPLTLRERIWIFFDDPQSSAPAYYFSISLFFFITLSTVIFIAQTERALDPYKTTLNSLEAMCAGVFSVEYSLRLLSAPSKWSFIKNLGNWVDLAAILPFYLEAIVNVENAGSFGAIRIVRLTRVARVLKMSRYSSAIQVFVQAIAISIRALSMLLFLMAIAVVVFSSAIYFAEFTTDGCRHGGWIGQCDSLGVGHTIAGSLGAAAAAGADIGGGDAASPQQCICVDPNPYSSIASSFWWSIVTMSTVGYGDMVPVTLAGRIVGVATILTGMLVLALPITVIGTNFQKVMKSVMHQTMKNNVDYLKGKKQVCREEIQAILQRFHAVTEDIHLNIDDVIQVYDTDNSGTLEDEELSRFRHDLEMLQNRAFHNQHMDMGGGGGRGHRDSTMIAGLGSDGGGSSGSSRSIGAMIRKLSGRGGSFLLPTLSETAGVPPTASRSPAPVRSPPPHTTTTTTTASTTTGTNQSTNAMVTPAKDAAYHRQTFAGRSLPSSPSPVVTPVIKTDSHNRAMVRGSRSQPNNIAVCPLPLATESHPSMVVSPAVPVVPVVMVPCAVDLPVTTVECLQSNSGTINRESSDLHSNTSPPSDTGASITIPTSTTPGTTRSSTLAGPSMDELLDDESEDEDVLSPSNRSDSQTSTTQSPSHHSHRSHHNHHSSHHSTSHQRQRTHRGHSPCARGHDAHGSSYHSQQLSDDDVMIMRLVEMQHTFEHRLKETEARLESKLLHLTKVLMRIETLIEMND